MIKKVILVYGVSSPQSSKSTLFIWSTLNFIFLKWTCHISFLLFFGYCQHLWMSMFLARKPVEFHNANCGYRLGASHFYPSCLGNVLKENDFLGHMSIVFISNLTKWIGWYYCVMLGDPSGVLRVLFTIALMVSSSIWPAIVSHGASVEKRSFTL